MSQLLEYPEICPSPVQLGHQEVDGDYLSASLLYTYLSLSLSPVCILLCFSVQRGEVRAD